MKRRGVSMVELLIAVALFSLIMTVAYSCWNMLNSTRATQQAAVESRQQMRTLLTELVNDLEETSYIYQGFNGKLDGHDFSVDAVPTAGNSGNSLVLAVPEIGSASLEGPLPTISTYTIITFWTQPLAPRDPKNPSALMGNIGIYTGVPSGTPSNPLPPASIVLASIDPKTLFTSHTDRPFPCYLLPPTPLGTANPLFTFTTSGTSVAIDLTIYRVPPTGPTQQEHMPTQVTIRAL